MVAKLAALGAILLYAAILLANVSWTAGGADSSGYLNEARMFARGKTGLVLEPLRTLRLDPSWRAAFTPTGFTWGKTNTTMAPGYPPGLPLHMLVAAWIAGWRIGPFLVSPLAALGCGVLMFAIARVLGISRPGAFLSAALLLLLPQFVAHAVQPVSDVLATFWALAAMFCALRSKPILGGAALAIGVWVRPTNILMLVPLLIAFGVRRRQSPLLLLAAAPFGIALLAYHFLAYGDPFRTGYGTFGDVVSWQHVATCARNFATWTMSISTPFLFPGAFAILFDRSRDRWIRVLLPVWFAVFFAFYCLWSPFDWWSTRFLLPGNPGLIFAIVMVLESIASRRNAVAIALIVVMLIARPIVACGEFRVLATDEAESIYRESVAWAERRMPRDAVLMSGSLSGAFFYYTGRFSVRPDQIDDDRFQLLRAYIGSRPIYAVVSPVEIPPDKLPRRFRGNWVKLGTFRGIELWRLDH